MYLEWIHLLKWRSAVGWHRDMATDRVL